jgi:hypothetical protein
MTEDLLPSHMRCHGWCHSCARECELIPLKAATRWVICFASSYVLFANANGNTSDEMITAAQYWAKENPRV